MAGQRDWKLRRQLNAFPAAQRGHGAENEAMDVPLLRRQEWRVEANIDLDRVPVLELAYRPEQWLLLTHGASPFVVVAGSRSQRRSDFPLDALVAQVRSRKGAGWTPPPAQLGAMQTAGGEAALTAYDAASQRNWVLWSILGLGALLIVVMVLRLLKAPQEP